MVILYTRTYNILNPPHEFLKEIDGVFHLYERVRKLNTTAHCLEVPSDRKEGHNEGADTSCVRVIFQRESLQLGNLAIATEISQSSN